MSHRVLFVAFLCGLLLVPPAGAQVQDVPAPSAPAQTEIRKKLIDATRSLSETLKALAKAEAAKVEAEAARQAAAKEADEARAKAEALRAEVAKLNRQLLDAARAQAVVARGGLATQERENADPQDPYERFAILTPGGPIVVQAAITVGGQPFRKVREKLIDDLLAAADKDKDGQATWDEAASSPRFMLGRLRVGNDQRQTMIRALDKNADGLVDRPEARLFVAQYFSAPAFMLNANAYGADGRVFVANGRVITTGGAQADVRALLDLDADGALSDTEIAAAA